MPRHPISILAAAAAVALALGAAQAAQPCCDFSGPAADARWGIQSSVCIDIGEVHIRPLFMNGQPFEAGKPEDPCLRRQDRQIAGGVSPALQGAYVAMQIVPSQRVRTLRMRFAQEQGADGRRPSFIEVNGGKHEFAGLLSKVNGHTLGQGRPRRAQVRAELAPTGAASLWHAGTLALRAMQGGIDQVTIGTPFFRADDVGIER